MLCLFIAEIVLFLLIFLFTIVLLCGGNRATDQLTRPARACIAAYDFNVSPLYARQALELMDKLKRAEISEQGFAWRGMQLTEYCPDDWKRGKIRRKALLLYHELIGT